MKLKRGSGTFSFPKSTIEIEKGNDFWKREEKKKV